MALKKLSQTEGNPEEETSMPHFIKVATTDELADQQAKLKFDNKARL